MTILYPPPVRVKPRRRFAPAPLPSSPPYRVGAHSASDEPWLPEGNARRPLAQASGEGGLTPQEGVTAALTMMEVAIRFNLRNCPRRDREELCQVARVAAWVAWSSLVSRGIDPIASGVTGIAFNAARTARAR